VSKRGQLKGEFSLEFAPPPQSTTPTNTRILFPFYCQTSQTSS